MLHFLYKTTNTVNGKFYIGRHSTKNVNDGYLGSGSTLAKAIKKYGKENFTREIVLYCNSYEQLIEEEKKIVNLELISNKMCYNETIGGLGGSVNCWDDRRRESHKKSVQNKTEDHKQKISKTLKKKWEDGTLVVDPAVIEIKRQRMKGNSFKLGVKDSEETKLKKSTSMLQSTTIGRWQREDKHRQQISERSRIRFINNNPAKDPNIQKKIAESKLGRKKMIKEGFGFKYAKPDQVASLLELGYRLTSRAD